jgi:hypothetical protein
VAAYDTGAAGKPRTVGSFIPKFPFRFTIERACIHVQRFAIRKVYVSSLNLILQTKERVCFLCLITKGPGSICTDNSDTLFL